MANLSICSVEGCDKYGRGRYCEMHRARLRRGGSFGLRKPPLTFSELLGGQTEFGDWTVLHEGAPYLRPLCDGRRNPGGQQRTAHCQCVCGEVRDIPIHVLKRGMSKGCGCRVPAITAARNITHGRSYTPEHKSWSAMKARCFNPRDKNYPDYGGRGITVCDAWRAFEGFFADMGERPSPKHTLDRIDVNGNYEPGNCRWAEPTVQANNKRDNRRVCLRGEWVSLASACRSLGLNYKRTHQRMQRDGLTFEQAAEL